MTQAVCFKCGKTKWGAFSHCDECQAKPKTDDEFAMSLALTDHYFQPEQLQQIGSEIMSGRPLQLPEAWREQLAPAVREAKRILGMDNLANGGRATQTNGSLPRSRPWRFWSWFGWYAKRRGDQNELDVLLETIQEHERGRHDNAKYIKEQMHFIERDHKRTPAVQQLLDRARRAIDD